LTIKGQNHEDQKPDDKTYQHGNEGQQDEQANWLKIGILYMRVPVKSHSLTGLCRTVRTRKILVKVL